MEYSKLQDKCRGSLVGGAVGDVLGYEVEFMSLSAIRKRFGAEGITRYVLHNGVGHQDCGQNDLGYFYYPVDNHAGSISKMVELFSEFCRLIDEGNFYISCVMGLHRTDIALCCYWMFYAADYGIVPPEIRGYRKEDGHNSSKIMCILNAMYKEFERTTGITPFSLDAFKERKKIIESQCSK